MQQTHFDYIVLGGGISGLTCSLELQTLGMEVCLIEKSDKTGGVLQTVKKENCYWDRSAHTLVVDDEILSFFKRFNLDQLLEEPDNIAKVRQIVVNNEIQNISNHPSKILTSKFLSPNAKWNLVKELFKKPIRIPNPTVREFFEYHFGTEITENIVSAVFSGIYSGDIEKMEMSAVMNNLLEIEQKSGSLIRGLIKQKKTFPLRRSFGIKGGMSALNNAMASLIDHLELGNEVTNVKKKEGIFYLETVNGIRTCKQLISCLPAYNLSSILEKEYSSLSLDLAKIQHNPMVLVHVAFEKSGNEDHKEAFGFLCSQFTSPNLKGAIYNSAIFPSRCPQNLMAYTIFVKPELDWLLNRKILDKRIDEIVSQFKTLTNIQGNLVHKEMTIWENGIPQFNRPFSKLKSELFEQAELVNGFSISGSYISGVSVADCIKYNVELATSLANS